MSNKKQTLEEAAEMYAQQNASGYFVEQKSKAFIAGAKYQSERMYSEEDMRLAFEMGRNFPVTGMDYIDDVLEKLNKNKK